MYQCFTNCYKYFTSNYNHQQIDSKLDISDRNEVVTGKGRTPFKEFRGMIPKRLKKG